jgi:hypothetical protein
MYLWRQASSRMCIRYVCLFSNMYYINLLQSCYALSEHWKLAEALDNYNRCSRHYFDNVFASMTTLLQLITTYHIIQSNFHLPINH